MRSFSPRPRATMLRLGRIVAALCLNACLSGCQPEDGARNAQAAGAPPTQMVEILGRLLVALCLTAFVGGCQPTRSPSSDGSSSGDEFPRLDPVAPDEASAIVAYLRSGRAVQTLIPGRPYPPRPGAADRAGQAHADG